MPTVPQRIHRVMCIPDIAEIVAAGCLSILERAADEELDELDAEVLSIARHFIAEYAGCDLGAQLVCTDVTAAANRFCHDDDSDDDDDDLNTDE